MDVPLPEADDHAFTPMSMSFQLLSVCCHPSHCLKRSASEARVRFPDCCVVMLQNDEPVLMPCRGLNSEVSCVCIEWVTRMFEDRRFLEPRSSYPTILPRMDSGTSTDMFLLKRSLCLIPEAGFRIVVPIGSAVNSRVVRQTVAEHGVVFWPSLMSSTRNRICSVIMNQDTTPQMPTLDYGPSVHPAQQPPNPASLQHGFWSRSQ